MSEVKKAPLRIALAGNPNAGKTSLFNAITGSHYKVGNYPGVTVEKREARFAYGDTELVLVDLPGIYSLTAYALDEVVTRDFLLEERPDVVIDVLDSTNLERNLYLCLQFQELGIPVVGALNMSDEARDKGIRIDARMLSATLGITLVPTVGTDGSGTRALLDAAIAAASGAAMAGELPASRAPFYGEEVEARLKPLAELLGADEAFCRRHPARWMAIKLLENDANAQERAREHARGAEVLARAEADRAWIRNHFGKESEIVITEQRYGYIHGAVKEAVRVDKPARASLTVAIDRVLMSKVVGLPLFLLVIWGIFKLTFVLGAYPAALLESGFTALAGWVSSVVPQGAIQSLLVDGVIGGVGGVFSFVPLIVILFLCISILEDTGYMSRAAFLTDKILHAVGLHGQSFMPLMLGFGCTVPAIMATRTLKSPRDRIATILAVPFMSCGAKLPVYVLLAGTFFPKHAGDVVMAMYASGVILSMLSTLFLRKTVLRGKTTPFVMELPPYRLPTVRGIFWHVWGKTWNYAKKAGTVILLASVLIWALTTFPAPPETSGTGYTAEERLTYSMAGRIGKFIAPVIKPLGFDWKLGVALIPGLTAKELVVSTLGILYGSETDGTENIASLQNALRADPSMNPLVAIAFMAFILVMPPCFASLATIRAEAGNKWMAFQVVYSIALAWMIAFAIRIFGAL